MTIRKTILGTALLASLTAAPLAPVLAQQAEPAQDAPMATQTAPATYSDTQLESFVEAAMAVSDIRRDFVAQMQAAESEEAARELQEDAIADMRNAIESTDGIDLMTYNEIGQAYQTDEDLGERIAALIDQRAPSTEGEG